MHTGWTHRHGLWSSKITWCKLQQCVSWAYRWRKRTTGGTATFASSLAKPLNKRSIILPPIATERSTKPSVYWEQRCPEVGCSTWCNTSFSLKICYSRALQTCPKKMRYHARHAWTYKSPLDCGFDVRRGKYTASSAVENVYFFPAASSRKIW